jgi:hypothetical protein
MKTQKFKYNTQESRAVDERSVSNGVSNIENIVMGRVHRIHFLRRYINRTTVKMYGAGILFGFLAGTVSLTNVFANMPSITAPDRVVDFLLGAIMNTETFVQVVVVSLILITCLGIYDIAKNTLQNKLTFAQ